MLEVARVKASTERTPLDLLALPWPFSQLQLLDVDEFVKEAKRQGIRVRGSDLDGRVLEELHRQRIVVPFFRIRLGNPRNEDKLDVAGSRTLKHIGSTLANQLFLGAIDGRVTDPATESFAPWPRDRLQSLWPQASWGVIYSYHQLHTLRRANSILQRLEPSRETVKSPTIWTLPDDARPSVETVDEIARWRSVAITLSTLDTVYWPRIMRVISFSASVWREVRAEFDPGQTLEWLGLAVEDVVAQADDFRYSAMFHDVLGDFYDLIRRARPSMWTSLTGPAAVTMEERIAGDVLHRFAEDIVPSPPKPAGALGEPLSHQWLSERPDSLDYALTDKELSPHPMLVLALEGETEMLLMPRVLDFLGIQSDPNFIRIVCFGGVDNPLHLLARFAAAPLIGREFPDHVWLDRPPTRFLVLTDAEKKYATAADRRHQRRLLLDSIGYGLPNDLRADLYGRSAHMVEIKTWGKYPFEFAHFTDRALAEAMIAASPRTFPGGLAALTAEMARQRSLSNPSVARAWPNSHVSKVKLADEMWPRIEQRMRASVQRGANGPPIMSNALFAYRLAGEYYGARMSLRRRRWRPRP